MSHPNSSSPVNFQSANLFEWLFSNPFENESDFTTAQQRVPRGSNGEKLLIDEATGKYNFLQKQLKMPRLTISQITV